MLKKIPSYWFAGTLIALAGVGIARWLAPLLEENGANHSLFLVVKTAGHLVAFAGIFFIAHKIGQKKSSEKETEGEEENDASSQR